MEPNPELFISFSELVFNSNLESVSYLVSCMDVTYFQRLHLSFLWSPEGCGDGHIMYFLYDLNKDSENGIK